MPRWMNFTEHQEPDRSHHWLHFLPLYGLYISMVGGDKELREQTEISFVFSLTWLHLQRLFELFFFVPFATSQSSSRNTNPISRQEKPLQFQVTNSAGIFFKATQCWCWRCAQSFTRKEIRNLSEPKSCSIEAAEHRKLQRSFAKIRSEQWVPFV